MTRLGIENLAKEVLKAVGVAPAPPIPVRLVAERLGVSDISTRPMVEDGALVRLGTVTNVLLREGRSPSRQRFTLAHELAHLLLLGDTELALEFRQVRRGRDAEESLCDDIAAALLMPTEWIRLRFSDRPMTLPTVRDLAQACEVSMAAALVRLDEVCGWRAALLRWREEGGRFRFVGGAGLPPPLFGQVGSASATTSVLTAARGPDRWVSLPLSVGRDEQAVRAHVSVRGPSAMALFCHLPLGVSTAE